MIWTPWKKKEPKTDSHEFKPLIVEIEEEPLNPLGRMIYWVIVSAIFFFSLWMYFGKVDVVVTARGKVIPTGEVKTIQPLTAGVVRKILIEPGMAVEKGQILMEIDPSEIDPELASMKDDLHQVELELMRLDALLGGTGFNPEPNGFEERLIQVQLDLYQAAKDRLQKQVRVKQEELRQYQERLAAQTEVHRQAAYNHGVASDRHQRLEKVKDLISKDDYQQARSEKQRFASEMMTSQDAIDEVLASIDRVQKEIDLIKEEERNRLLAELAEKRQRQVYLQGRIEQADFRSKRQQLRSPVKGRISQLLFHTVGGVVSPAERLATIVPDDSPLQIKAMVMNKDVGFLTQDMDVAIKIDTFEFQKYGMLDGKLLQVSTDSIEDERIGLVYEAYVHPLQTSLMVEGVDTAITPGMGVTAEMKVGKRRIIEFFIYPLIKYLDEGISVR